ncbi:MAG: hypothetical protein HN995_08970 [Candidatus Marinimicrobia bacterium]|nr:hypothetical protein [Candidatus Neomarinimicrobiota bacterium]MBT3576261.1 hypothetical protein [Candidatus Neomarinimicrobiota bacterium]MBT3680804.1 hypothetical protein [Candidatus Neomarinimicrobiota bacterium]MBT3950747.1 hypothetical protein [Candidatus Neomarinimicrobiota bacterium]MBT4252325.1 hypothetical protein [Candidatus Neomarinimicrobiota bacterium]
MNQHLLHCPISKTALKPAGDSLINAINSWVEGGQIFNGNGDLLRGNYTAMLVSKNQSIAYNIRHGIPQLIPGLSISLEGLNTGNSVD